MAVTLTVTTNLVLDTLDVWNMKLVRGRADIFILLCSEHVKTYQMNL